GDLAHHTVAAARHQIDAGFGRLARQPARFTGRLRDLDRRVGTGLRDRAREIGEEALRASAACRRVDDDEPRHRGTDSSVPRVSDLDLARLPKHVAIVMDGNGRWAQQRGLRRTDGHAAGEEALFDTVDGALDIGLEWMTVFAFSTENWRRP